MENIVIGIEGLVGSGKTSICRCLLNVIPNSVLLNGGNLYRTIIYALMQEKGLLKLRFKMKNIDIYEIMQKYKIEIKIENNETVFYIDGIKADEEKLQSKKNSLGVSVIGGLADNTKLFEFAKKYTDEIKQKYNVIISGRSIMKMYPELDYHFFITAELDERIKRKCKQYNIEKDDKKGILEVKKNIKKRDKLQKIAGFYKLSPKTIKVDVTECKNVRESVKKIIKNLD